MPGIQIKWSQVSYYSLKQTTEFHISWDRTSSSISAKQVSCTSEQRPLLEMNRAALGGRSPGLTSAHEHRVKPIRSVSSAVRDFSEKTKQDFAHPEMSICPGWASALLCQWVKADEGTWGSSKVLFGSEVRPARHQQHQKNPHTKA